LGLLLAAPVVPAQKLLAQGVPAQNQTAPAVTPAAAPPLTPPAAPAATPNHKSTKFRRFRKFKRTRAAAAAEWSAQSDANGPNSSDARQSQLRERIADDFAQNSTLGEILRDVRKLTGASIEIPQGSGASERVIAHLGPGAPATFWPDC